MRPPNQLLRRSGNTAIIGYARGHCTHFPTSSDGADAVRFSITNDQDGAIGLLYILEKDYGPLRHAPLVYDAAAGDFTGPLESGTLRAQAQQFVRSYLSRRVKT